MKALKQDLTSEYHQVHEELKEIKQTVEQIARLIDKDNTKLAMYSLGIVYERLKHLEVLSKLNEGNKNE